MRSLKNTQSVVSILLVLFGLVLVYLFQYFSYWDISLKAVYPEASLSVQFIFNKSVRFLINDLLVVWLIWIVFNNKDYVRLGMAIQLIEMLVLLPLYFILKIELEGPTEISSPLLSQFHRLIINPVLIMVFFFGLILSELKNET